MSACWNQCTVLIVVLLPSVTQLQVLRPRKAKLGLGINHHGDINLQ